MYDRPGLRKNSSIVFVSMEWMKRQLMKRSLKQVKKRKIEQRHGDGRAISCGLEICWRFSNAVFLKNSGSLSATSIQHRIKAPRAAPQVSLARRSFSEGGQMLSSRSSSPGCFRGALLKSIFGRSSSPPLMGAPPQAPPALCHTKY